MQQTIGFLGAGNMASAMIDGILRAGLYQPRQVAVFDINRERLDLMRQKGIQTASDASALASACPVLVVAVKPQQFEEALTPLHGAVGRQTLFVSIVTGVATDRFSALFGFPCRVVRAMPNTPLLLGEGATALCRSSEVDDAGFALARRIFEASGVVEVLPEEKMNAVVPVNGSSPAYVYLFAKAMLEGASNLGIDQAQAKRLVAQTLIGSAKMLTSSGYSPEELIRMVSSPGGTTLKALEALREHGFEEAILDAMERCAARAEELGR